MNNLDWCTTVNMVNWNKGINRSSPDGFCPLLLALLGSSIGHRLIHLNVHILSFSICRQQGRLALHKTLHVRYHSQL